MPVSNRRKVKMVKNVDDVKYMLLNYVEPGDVIFTMGAGNITRLGSEFLESMRARNHEIDYNNIPASMAAV